MKTCTACHIEKPIDAFEPKVKNGKHRHGKCRQCRNARRHERRIEQLGIDGERDRSRNLHYIKKYGISLEEYNSMLVEQDYTCKICNIRKVTHRGFLFVDHDHRTGKIRGLLCSQCNSGLGYFADDISRLERAIVYLK